MHNGALWTEGPYEKCQFYILVIKNLFGITVVYRYMVKSGIHVTKRYRKKRKFFNPGLTMGLSRIKERIN